MPFGYPVMLEVAGRRCVVIGADAVREGKVEAMIGAGADDVLVVSPGPGGSARRTRARRRRRRGTPSVARRRPERRVPRGRGEPRGRRARRDRPRSPVPPGAGERDGRHPQLRLVGTERRASRRPRPGDRDRRRLAGSGEEAAPGTLRVHSARNGPRSWRCCARCAPRPRRRCPTSRRARALGRRARPRARRRR